MKHPFLSIITINYNDATGLQDTMTSVLEQTCSDFEYILIDGGSDDGSLDVIKKHEEKLAYWVSEKDTGIYNAMNKGIKIAKGEYLLFLNSGDALTAPTALTDFSEHELFKGDIIYGDYTFENGQKIYPDTLPPNYFMKTSLPHQSTFFKANVFDQMGYYDEQYKIGADRAFYIKCFDNKAIRFQHIPYFLTLFDLSGLSNDPEFISKKKEEDQRMFREFYGARYDMYLDEVKRESQRKKAERSTPKGIWKRVKNRILKWRS